MERVDNRTGQKVSTSGRRGVLLAACIVGSVLAGWQIITTTMADSRVLSRPVEALRWRPDSAPALVALGERQLTQVTGEVDLAEVEALGEAAVLASPLEQRALRLLALVADVRGEPQAGLLMTRAAERAPRDALAQLWLFERRMQAGEHAAAMINADFLMRARPDLRMHILPALFEIISSVEGPSHVIPYVASDPPWRRWFLQELGRAARPAVVYEVLRSVASLGRGISADEIRPFLDRLISERQYELAHLTWIALRASPDASGLSYLANGGFELPISNLPFDWIRSDVRGATTEIVPREEADGARALRVTFANTRVPYRHMASLLVLPPGDFVFAGRARSIDLDTERGLTWRIRCAEAESSLVGETARLKGNLDWHEFSVHVTVPDFGCRAQWLRLELDARVASEQLVSGEVWYDDLSIARAVAN